MFSIRYNRHHEPGFKYFCRYRLAKQKALHFVAVQRQQLAHLMFGFDTLSYDVDLQCMCHHDDGVHQRQPLRRIYPNDKKAIDLQRIYRQFRKITEQEKARPKSSIAMVIPSARTISRLVVFCSMSCIIRLSVISSSSPVVASASIESISLTTSIKLMLCNCSESRPQR
jgi:hypothetical protein